MKINKSIWKTAAMAVVITLVGAAFITRLSDWTRGLNSEFLVYGQTSTGGTSGSSGTSGGTTTTPTTISKIIPQVAFGSFDGLNNYSTTIMIINDGSSAVNVTAEFYTQLGGNSTAVFTKNVNGTVTNFTGTMPSTTLAVNSIIVITSPSTGAGAVNWGSIDYSSTGTVTVGGAFEVRDATTNVLYSRVGVAGSPANMKQFVIPRARNLQSGLDFGYAVVNTGTGAATITVSIYGPTGLVLASKDLTLAAKNQTAVFARDFFGTGLVDPATGTSFSFFKFTSTSAQFAALALAIEGSNLASFPVDQLQ